jgi:uncharacterized protein with HEPN domain
MKPKNWGECLQPLADMLEYVEACKKMSEGRGQEDLETDFVYQMAALHVVQTIGEAARRVPESARLLAPEIPWREIVGARSRIAHDYDRINILIIQHVIENELEGLEEKLRSLIKTVEGLKNADTM